jgi:hypothetical protein
MKNRLKALLPAPLLHLARCLYSPTYRQGLGYAHQQRLIAAARAPLLAASDNRVMTGPLAGMHCADAAVCSAWTPKLLGTYEKELHPIFANIIATGYDWIIDIGAAEGYYAIGLALQMPQTKVIAYEATSEGRDLLAAAAQRNNMAERIDIRGLCGTADLAQLLHDAPSRVLVICDAEGAEVALLNPAEAPGLVRCDVLVELHPWAVAEPKETINARFAPHAQISLIAAQTRQLTDYPAKVSADLNDETRLACMDEQRPPNMEWLWIESTAAHA